MSTDIAALDAAYTKTTDRWGRITLLLGLLIATSVPFYLLFTVDLNITAGNVIGGFLAVAAVYGVFWVVEPLTYYPILGPAGMYQAFMIGNISNKLLPSAIVAQSTIGAKPGTKKAEFAATAAICGAALIHVISMLLLVGILGSWLVSITPPGITEIAQNYILPSILGGVTVQLIATLKQVRATVIALSAAALVVFVLLPLVPVLGAVGIALAVIITIIATWLMRPASMRGPGGRGPGSTGDGEQSSGGQVGIN
ncbi:hypothetical protein [Brevibacterium jeotgali]|uniref:Uncharacterized protein n=1 Tax=Brevibacterium jeotgali TaxID=1262550 RepID=A0A2H1L4T8_9MICO|nr:hypothetical protein [Brevibacterium jeotgali]TWC01493.1 hypothetical protein FB108_0139 [Brevibacterium jeotgali]SMY11902.1 hypothetical protein BJEO58_01494 [Brevibacterium jeotgali]